jgi:hypothetical protein
MKAILSLLFLPSVLPLSAPACSSALDPPSLARWDADYLSVPLGVAAGLSDCISLCCASSACVSFSYNFPQPSRTCVGATCCEESGKCCMLKDGAGDLRNNTFPPGEVTTGQVRRAALPGPTPPFPNSTLITGVAWGPVRFWDPPQADPGDTWPSAWAADGSTYAWDCDGWGSPMSLWRLDGSPFAGNGSVRPALRGSLQAIDYAALCAPYGPTGSFPKINVKPAGMMALPASAARPNGTLLAGVSCMNYGDDAGFNRQHNLGGFIAESADAGLTWRNATPVGGAFAGRFAAPAFVSCGRANAPCSAKDGGWLYVFFAGSFDDAAYWDNNDALFLARAPEAAPANASAYEYFCGLDAAGAPRWRADASQAQASLEYALMVGENPVAYVPQLGRYLFANFGFLDSQGQPRPWHTQPYMAPHRTQLVLLEAPAPWGPWSVFWRDDDSFQAPGLYTPTFPAQWVQEVVGNKLALGFAFACLGGSPLCRYTLNYQTLELTLAAVQ